MASDRRLRVLIVEDEAEIRDILTFLLNHWGHGVRVATNGEEALQVADDYRPDVIVSDIAMPRMDGWEMMRRLRCLPHFRETFCVALTGLCYEGVRKRSEEVGFDMYLVKPVDPEALKAVIAMAVFRLSQEELSQEER